MNEFQRRKMRHHFRHTDANGDGQLERADYERQADRFCELHRLIPGTDAHKAFRDRYLLGWDQLVGMADTNGDGRVSFDEYMACMEQLTSNAEIFSAVAIEVANDTMRLSDLDGDGRLSRQEFTNNLLVHGVGADKAEVAFEHLDRNGDGFIDVDELRQNVHEFFHATDESAPGNWLMGPLG